MVVIETDDQTRESIRVMDNVKALIGNKGARFENSFVNYSLCCPSRATFLTGQYAHNHGVLDNTPPDGGFPRFESLHGNNNLAVWLQDSGYYTALIGKYLNGYDEHPLVPPGWSEWYASQNQAVYNYRLNENGTPVHYGDQPADFKQDVLTRKAVGLHRPPGAEAEAVLPLAHLHGAALGRPSGPEPAEGLPRHREAGAAPRPCLRLRAAAEAPELQRAPTSPTSRRRSGATRS